MQGNKGFCPQGLIQAWRERKGGGQGGNNNGGKSKGRGKEKDGEMRREMSVCMK